MAKSLSQLMTQIEKLKKEAESIQTGIVDRIRKEIAKHGLTADHLFGSSSASAAKPAKPTASKSAAGKSGASARFSDSDGNSWSGMGPKPAWLRAALDLGRSIEEFLSPGSAAGSAKKPAKSKSSKPVKFADDAGHTWGGVGKRPDWIRSALEAGKSLDDFLVGKSKPKAAAPAAAPAKKAKPAGKRAAPAKKAVAKSVAKPVAKSAAKPAAKKATAPVKAKPAPAGKKAAVKRVAAKKAKPAAAATPAADQPAA